MTAVEVEQEHEKVEKIAAAAARGRLVAADLGQDPNTVEEFLKHYFRHVDALDVDSRSVDDLLALVESHYRAAVHRPPARAAISVLDPGERAAAGGATVVQIVTDDQPFLVDSVTMEVLRQGWSIREIFHPQFLVTRDLDGGLTSILNAEHAAAEPAVLAESWMHLEILPPSRTVDRDQLVAELEQGLREVLRLVEEAVEDWAKMTQRAAEVIAELAGPTPLPERAAEAAQAAELLTWLGDHHFTFLGYRAYRLVRTETGDRYDPVPATGLGILRGDVDPPDAFDAVPLPGRRPELLVITKDSQRSRIHRSTYLDYIGIRQFDDAGRVVGERRFLGLLSTSAYAESVLRVPVLRQRAAAVLAHSGYDAHSHGGKALIDVLESYPRDELFAIAGPDLEPVVEKIAHLRERRQVRLFLRRDPYGRAVSCLVYLPRDRYTTAVRQRMQQILLRALGGVSVDYTARVTESVLARLHVVVWLPPGPPAEVDPRALERELTAATRSWDDEFADVVAASNEAPQDLSGAAARLPEGYKADYAPAEGLRDLLALRQLPDTEELLTAIDLPDREGDQADLRLKIFRPEALSLSSVLPHLSLLGVDVIDERPYALPGEDGSTAYVYDFGLRVPGGREGVRARWDAAGQERFTAALAASYAGRAEPDAFQALVMGAALDWRQVALLRAIGRYLRQAGVTYSQTYLASALSANVDVTRQLVAVFAGKFDPQTGGDRAAREARTEQQRQALLGSLDDVASLDHDRILRAYLSVMSAAVRTNAFVPDRPTIAVKLLAREIAELPEPRPAFEIFVYSPRLEGVHLRFGTVARGGLRWSDRAEDFRTEVLGLVKAQMVKNTVIVPVGAKGGFYAKRLPDPGDRDAWLAEGVACYQLFIGGLLDLTDNLRGDGAVEPPKGVLRYDADDPYLVVAADKGTATFSDLANEIAVDRGFWLGDAFASGGSAGYDHKVMGITARGAWESVRRHFRELGIDDAHDDFSCVGVGDMSGDVFGNGMLLSDHTRLLAAFDHRHVFIDPDPDPTSSFAERRRLFELPRSSWADYDRSLLSAGGGVFPRTQKSVPISEPIRTALGLDRSVTALSPADLISACLRAPVDLLFNGGIGTYVKAASETPADVGDKANDGLRVNGRELRARCVGEGGNLGLTQRGRIEYAATGGLINTDFVDNSAGVDTSDHEVNIKILLAADVAAGRLTMPERNALLASMTDDVAGLVLAHNRDQNLALANAVHKAPSMLAVHEAWIERLETIGLIHRELEALPSTDEVDARLAAGRGLTTPELASLMAYTKIWLEGELLGSDLPDDPELTDRLVDYFPSALRERYAAAMATHRLHREIVATVVVNEFVDRAGITAYARLSDETGVAAADVVRAQIAARRLFGAGALDEAVRGLDHVVAATLQTELRIEVRTLVERGTRWLLHHRRRPLDIAATIEAFGAGVAEVQQTLPELLTGRDADAWRHRHGAYVKAGVPDELARAIAVLPLAYGALSVVQNASRLDLPVRRVADLHFALGQRVGLDRLLTRIIELPRKDRWQSLARAALRDDLHDVHAALTALVLAEAGTGRSVRDLLHQWEQRNPDVPAAAQTLRSLTGGRPDLAKLSVGVRAVRALVPTVE